jgi:hypothetical protein
MTKMTVIQLMAVCFIVGLVMTYYRVTPSGVVAMAVEWAKAAFSASASLIGTAGSYILLGAVLVVPMWLAYHLLWPAREQDSEK